MSSFDTDRSPTLRELYTLFIPLAFSGAFFPVARPVINAALARTESPELALAAYGVALSVAMPLVSPLFGLRQIITALCVDRDMIGRLARLVWYMGGGATLVLLVLSIPSVYMWVTDRVLGIPEEISRLGPPAMLLLATSPLLLIGRGYYQSILVRYGNANPIGVGAFGYLVGCSVVVFAAVLWFHLPGAVAAALALLGGNVVYLLIVWPPTRPMYVGDPPRIPLRDDSFAPEKRSTRYVLSLYHPLAASMVLAAGVEPVVQGAMAHSPDVRSSLAAYAVCVSIVWLARTNLWNTQQVVIARCKGTSVLRGGPPVRDEPGVGNDGTDGDRPGAGSRGGRLRWPQRPGRPGEGIRKARVRDPVDRALSARLAQPLLRHPRRYGRHQRHPDGGGGASHNAACSAGGRGAARRVGGDLRGRRCNAAGGAHRGRRSAHLGAPRARRGAG